VHAVGSEVGATSEHRLAVEGRPPAPPRELGLMHKLYKPTIFAALARVLPERLHPNVITIAGQLCALGAAVLAYSGACGLLLAYPASAALHFAYLAADNVDGMHARRTGRVSLAGEVLDHGLDGLAIVGLALTFGFVLQVDGLLLVTMTWLATLGFLLAHWEHRQTGHFGPVTCQSDGFTLGVSLELVACLWGNPPWLRLSLQERSLPFFLFLGLGGAAAVAIAGPLRRAASRPLPGRSRGLQDPLVVATSLALLHGYVVAGAPAWLVAATVGVAGTEAGIRAIDQRLRGVEGRLWSPLHPLLLVPVVPALVAPRLWSATGWASLAAALAVVGCAHALGSALRHARRRDLALIEGLEKKS
jgi:phosphatidylglycerophosphate synthase